MAPLTFKSLLELDSVEIADLFNRCFEDYVISFTMTPQSAAAHWLRDGVDLARSFVTMRGEDAIAVTYIAPRFDRARLAAMGVVKEARAQGVGKIVVAEFLRRLREDGFRIAAL